VPFPRAADEHKPGRPLVPNCYGIFYSLASVCYWFVLYFLGVDTEKTLALATSVLFGSNMGLFDDLVNLPWRYKAVLPVFAALPYMVLKPSDRTTISSLFVGVVDLGSLFFILLVPAIVTVAVNSYNQLGGLNGLEALTGLILIWGLALASRDFVSLIVPLLMLVILFCLSFTGRAFIGNVGSFSIGLTFAVYAIMENLKIFLLISLAPFVLNSLLILFSRFFLHERADTQIDDRGFLHSNKVRSLRSLLLHYRPMSERMTVLVLSFLVLLSVILSLFIAPHFS